MKRTVFCILIFLSACNNNAGEDNKVDPVTPKVNEEKRLKDAIARYPDSLLLKEELIEYYSDNDNYASAFNEIDAVLAKDSTNARFWNINAVLHFKKKDTLNAISSLEKAVLYFPDEHYIFSLGSTYAQVKKPRAIQMADALLGGYKGKADKEAFYIKGLYYSFTNEKQKAIGFFDKCLALNYTYMDAYREKAIALYDLGKYEEAFAVLDKAITLQNNFDEGYYYSGKCLEKLNRIPEAIQSYQNALVYDPDYGEAKEALRRLVGSGK